MLYWFLIGYEPHITFVQMAPATLTVTLALLPWSIRVTSAAALLFTSARAIMLVLHNYSDADG